MNWRGVPIVLDWTVLIGLPWLYFLRHRRLADAATAFVAFFVLMLIHELGHAAMAKWRKVPVLEIRLLIMHGYCRHERPNKQSDAIWIAWGGVAAQCAVLLMALGVSELLKAHSSTAYLQAHSALDILIVANFIIGAVNLLPVAPLDGAKAWLVVPMLWDRLPKANLRRWWRNRKLQRQSKEVAADIIERLKKKQ
jgi:Zn-dependent protease